MRKVALVAALALTSVLSLAAIAVADHGEGKQSFSTRLDGWAEAPSIVTTGHGSFRLRVVSPLLWEFVLRWEDMEGGAVTAAHIHVGSHHESGGVSAWLCGGATQPPCPPGPEGEVRGTIDPTDVTGPGPRVAPTSPPDQGVEPGNMADLLRAMRAGETYVNVHTTPRFPGGEIRGQLHDRHNHSGRGHGHDHDHDDDD